MKINLNEIAKVSRFANVASSFVEDVDVISGKYLVAGSSLMGLFSLDLSKPVEARIDSEDPEVIRKFEEAMKEFE